MRWDAFFIGMIGGAAPGIIMLLITFFRRPRPTPKKKPFHGCPVCGAEIMRRCYADCSNSQYRGENAPLCFDTLHHHCPLIPWCEWKCVNHHG